MIDVDAETGHVEYHIHPDPGRYDRLDRDGEVVWNDRFDDVYFRIRS